jgi:hypothetical protein
MNWSAKLARPLTLKTGDRLVTLGDAGDAMVRYFQTTVEDQAVALAIERLLQAAETGEACRPESRN